MKGGKMNIKKVFIAGLVVALIGGTIVFAANSTYAQTNNPLSGLAQLIASKFGLDQNKVQDVINQFHTQKQQQAQQTMQDREKQRLDKLVQDGKITSAQETAIINELATIRNEYNPANLQNLTPEQRKQKMLDMQNELKTWAQSLGIDQQYVMPGFSGRGKMGMGMHWKQNITPTP